MHISSAFSFLATKFATERPIRLTEITLSYVTGQSKRSGLRHDKHAHFWELQTARFVTHRLYSATAMYEPGEIISYREMCDAEGASLQRGMNFRHHGSESVILMSLRQNAPYRDRLEDAGRILVYEGHDVSKTTGQDPKTVDQPMRTPSGRLTQNGLFWEAAQKYIANDGPAEIVRVYEKIRTGIWVFNGTFRLVGAQFEQSGRRKVFEFRLEVTAAAEAGPVGAIALENERFIPSHVKIAVWKRDKGRCVKCGSSDNLHFDHVIPFSLGGSSIIEKNIQLMCARHNLQKRDKLE